MKYKYIGKSGQVKKGELVDATEKIEGRAQTRCTAHGRSFIFNDDTLEPAFIYASDLPAGFVDALFAVQDQVMTRVLWPSKLDQKVRDTFSENGLILPDDARPLKNKQWDWSGEMRFPDMPSNLTPDGTVADATGWLRCSRRDVVLAVLKAGFPLTSYAKDESIHIENS